MQNVYDPFFMIKIDGNSISKDFTDRIVKFEYEDTDDKDDILTLTLDNNDLAITDEPIIAEGGVVSFNFGYLDRLSGFKQAKIKDVEGFKEIKITAYQIPYSASTPPPPPPKQQVQVQTTNSESSSYTVKKGDNLTKISKMLGLNSWKDIYDDPGNKKIIGKNPNLIYPGQVLNIPTTAKPNNSNVIPDPPNTSETKSNANPQGFYAQKSKVHEKMKYSDVASKIASELGLNPKVEDSKIKYDSIPQINEDDISFLKRLAKEIGFICYMYGSDLHFHPTDYSTKAQRKLVYYIEGAGEVMDFYPRLKTQKVTSKANVANTSTLDKNKNDSKVGQSKDTKLGNVSYVVDGITGKEKRVITPLKSSSNDKLKKSVFDDEMETSGGSTMVETEKKWIEADISCIGIPEITAGSLVEIQGVGKKWSGNWYMKTIRHSIDSSGYTTSIECTRNALNQPAKISDDVEGPVNNSKSTESNNKKKQMIIVDGITGEERKEMIN